MQGGLATAGRKRAAVELIAREDSELRQTARRHSLCAEDAEDAYQRSLEILLVKAPTERPRELIRWMKTVVKHEAMAIRGNRERLLGSGEDGAADPIARLAAGGAGPGERFERHEDVARSREALQALKPAELRSLTLLAAGYSYAEIGKITGYSRTKVNRCLAEGRERFRRLLTASEDGGRCAELAPLLSAYCDGEASSEAAAAVREHLRACAACRAAMRAYRATPAAVAALAPLLPASRSLLERAQELYIGLQGRLAGGGAANGGGVQLAAAGGTGGAGMAALAKGLAICAATVGGAAACVATGVAPAPPGIEPERSKGARVERVAERVIEAAPAAAAEHEPAPLRAAAPPSRPSADRRPQSEPATAEPAPEAAGSGAVEYAPPPEPPPPAPEPSPAPPPPEPTGASSGSAAGEFGP